MNLSEYDISLIEKAVLQSLTEQEQQDFETRLKSLEFKEAFEEHRALVAGIQESGRSQMKDRLKDLEHDYKNKPNVPVKWGYLMLLAVVIVLVLFAIFKAERSAPAGPDLYAALYEPYPNVVDPIRKNQAQSELSPFQLYEQERYAEAINAIGNPSTDEELWYLIQCQLGIENYKDATIGLDVIIDKGVDESEYYTDALWYRLLLAARNEDGEVVEKMHAMIKKSDDGIYLNKLKDFERKSN